MVTSQIEETEVGTRGKVIQEKNILGGKLINTIGDVNRKGTQSTKAQIKTKERATNPKVCGCFDMKALEKSRDGDNINLHDERR